MQVFYTYLISSKNYQAATDQLTLPLNKLPLIQQPQPQSQMQPLLSRRLCQQREIHLACLLKLTSLMPGMYERTLDIQGLISKLHITSNIYLVKPTM